jgi:hypothetical protein
MSALQPCVFPIRLLGIWSNKMKSIIEIKILDADSVEVTSVNKDKSTHIDILTKSSDLTEFDDSTKIICGNLWN